MRRLSPAAGGVAVGVMAAVVLCINLGGYTLWDMDEGQHAETARELFVATDWHGWIVPSLNFEPYYHKPILFYWLTSASYAVGGVNELAARAVPAAAALAVVLAAYVWATRMWGVGAGVAAALILVTAGEFAVLGRYVNLDMLLTLWLTLGLFAVQRWTERAEPRGASLAPAALCGALGLLTKGLVAPLLIGGIGIAYLAVTRQLHLLSRAGWVRSILVFVGIAAPWYLAVGIVDPEFLQEFFLRHHYQRFFSPGGALHGEPIYYYLPVLIICFLPWSVLLPAAAYTTLAKERRGRPELFCVCWVLGIFVFFSLSEGKLGTYMLPAMPPLALLTGRYVSGMFSRPNVSGTERRLLVGGLMCAGVVSIVAAPTLVILARRAYEGALTQASYLTVLFVPLGAMLIALVRRGSYRAAVLTLGGGTFAVLCAFYQWAAPQISAMRSDAALAATIAAAGPYAADAKIVSYCVRARSLMFYSGRPVRRLVAPNQLARVLEKHPLVLIVSLPKHMDAVREVATVFPWNTQPRHKLYASRPLPVGVADRGSSDTR